MPALPSAARARANRITGWLNTRGGSIAAPLAIIAVGVALTWLPAFRALDLALLDAKFALLARYAPLPVDDGIVIVGIDDATLAAVPEPVALSHRMLGQAFAAIAATRPRAVGLDVILPDRSYDAFAPGSDQALIAGLLALRRVAPVIIGVTTLENGRLRPIHPPLLAAAGSTGEDVALLHEDEDGRVRRYEDRFGARGEVVATLVGRLAATTGTRPERGLVQYALGTGFDYVPMRDVLGWVERGERDKLDAAFAHRIVLIGPLLPHEDRKRQPVALARWEPGLDTPGVVVHAQMLRTQLAGATVRDAPWPAQIVLLLLAAALWFVPTWRWRAAAFVGLAAGSFALSLVLLRGGIELPLGAAARVALTAAAARSALEAWRVRRDRQRLTALFGGYVSPAVMDAILSGRITPDLQHDRRPSAFLFADIREFTALSASAPPEIVFDVLNRYFAAMTPVLHAQGGTIDNFRGDGLMAIFGAPNRLPDPAGAAVRAARAMFTRLVELNRVLAAEGVAPLAIGVSLAYGDAIVGNVGSNERYNYTAIGDAANVAARLQEITKTSGFPLVATRELVAHAQGEASAGWIPLGETAVRGHAPVVAFGWRPPDSPAA